MTDTRPVHFLIQSFFVCCSFGILAIVGGCGADNVTACELYVKIINTEMRKCGETELNPNVECPASLNQGGADCTDYYQCNATVYSCDEAQGTVTPDADLQANCPTTCI